MNLRAVATIFRYEMARFYRTLWESLASPVLSTVLYFVVFGAAIGSRMPDLGGVEYGAFIIPGLLMLTLLGETTSNASFGIYRCHSCTKGNVKVFTAVRLPSIEVSTSCCPNRKRARISLHEWVELFANEAFSAIC